ncbi:MAG: hypothetical protein VB140_02210 [Burkholderia sp.]
MADLARPQSVRFAEIMPVDVTASSRSIYATTPIFFAMHGIYELAKILHFRFEATGIR